MNELEKIEDKFDKKHEKIRARYPIFCAGYLIELHEMLDKYELVIRKLEKSKM